MSPENLTMVIRQPKAPRARELLLEQVRHVVKLYGGRVTSTAHGDEISLSMKLADRLPTHEVEAARQELATQFPERLRQA
ncbi:4-oxalocrotonate tautomerase [Pseudomonas chlororaphis]